MANLGLGLLGALGIVQGGGGGAPPPLSAGAKMASLGDSIIARGHSSTTAGARTTSQNRGNSELTWAMARDPRFIHNIHWASTATAALDIPTYGFASAQDNLWRGANFGYSGDTCLGITRRTAQIISSGAAACYVSAGTNTDSPNTAAEKQTQLDAALTALTGSNVYCILGTIRPRWSGDRETLTNVASVSIGSAVVRIVRNAHGLTNTSATTKEMEFVSPGLTIDVITINGWIKSGTGGYTVNVVDANTIDITTPTLALSNITLGGGSFTWHRNVYTDGAGTTNVGLCLMPSDPRHQAHRDTNDWIIAQAGRSKVVVADLTSALRDAARSAITGVYLEPYSWAIMDGVHAAPRGAAAAGAVLETKIAQLIAPGDAFNKNPATSNLLTIGDLAGTAGTVPASFTGQMPTGWQFDGGLITNTTGTVAVATNPDTSGQYLNINGTVDGAGTANTFSVFRFTPTTKITTGFTSTDWVQAMFEVEVVSTTAGILPCFQATMGQSTTISNRGLGQTRSDYNTEPYPDDLRRYWILTEPLLVEARTSLNPRLDLSVRKDVAGSFTFRIRRVIVRLVTDPTTQFPWVP